MYGFTSAVNQKQVYAELLHAQAAQTVGQRSLQQALLESAALQLRYAYRFYLAEIAAAFHCSEPEGIADLWTLIAHLQLQGKHPPETSELYNLEERAESWLSRLHTCCEAVAALPDMRQSASVDPDRIPSFSSAKRDDWSVLSCAEVGEWLAAFGEMVERHRDSMVEF